MPKVWQAELIALRAKPVLGMRSFPFIHRQAVHSEPRLRKYPASPTREPVKNIESCLEWPLPFLSRQGSWDIILPAVPPLCIRAGLARTPSSYLSVLSRWHTLLFPQTQSVNSCLMPQIDYNSWLHMPKDITSRHAQKPKLSWLVKVYLSQSKLVNSGKGTWLLKHTDNNVRKQVYVKTHTTPKIGKYDITKDN